MALFGDTTPTTGSNAAMPKAFDLGKVDIHSVSALAIDEVHIGPGPHHPVEITVVMTATRSRRGHSYAIG